MQKPLLTFCLLLGVTLIVGCAEDDADGLDEAAALIEELEAAVAQVDDRPLEQIEFGRLEEIDAELGATPELDDKYERAKTLVDEVKAAEGEESNSDAVNRAYGLGMKLALLEPIFSTQ